MVCRPQHEAQPAGETGKESGSWLGKDLEHKAGPRVRSECRGQLPRLGMRLLRGNLTASHKWGRKRGQQGEEEEDLVEGTAVRTKKKKRSVRPHIDRTCIHRRGRESASTYIY